MKIAFFSEGEWTGTVDRRHTNMRTDLAWQCALGAFHYPMREDTSRMPEGYYDLGIIILSKRNPDFNIESIQRICKKVSIMQEGPFWYWQDWPLHTQFEYITLLSNVDHIYVHNQSDRLYYLGILNHDRVYVLPSLMIDDAIDTASLANESDRTGVMIGGNFVSWYGGFDSYMTAQHFNQPIYAPSMGRKLFGEENIEGIEYLPYMSWQNWITELSKRKYAVHLMRTHAAGTFALNCASLGIPCIGYYGLDTQQLLHPKCSVDVGDLHNARQIATLLAHDTDFYGYCSAIAIENYKGFYREEVFLQNFNETVT